MSNINRSVTLTKTEQAIAKYLAKGRYDSSREAGLVNSKLGKQSNEFTDLEGISGEMAFCKIFNLYPDINIKPVTQDEDVGDCIYKGFMVDVKTTSYDKGKLICVPWKKDRVHMYALMVGKFPTYSFRGFASAKTLKHQSKLTDLGYGDVYAMEQNELNDF